MTTAMQKTNGTPRYGLENLVDNIFSNSMRRFFDGNLWDIDKGLNKGSVPVNVRETEHQYEVDVIAPGCRKEDFSIQVLANELTISLNLNEGKEEKEENAGWVRNEYIQRSFSRSFTLDETVNTAKITARYNNGILQVVLPKSEKAKPVSIAIDVN